MKYIAKHDLPFVKKGEEVKVFNTNGKHYVYNKDAEAMVHRPLIEWEDSYDSFDNWFEPKRWRAERGEQFFSIDIDGSIMQNHGGAFDKNLENLLYEMGNYFKSHFEAEKARALVLEALKKAHK